MRLPVVLTPEAQADYDEAYDWYERKAPGQGDVFAAKVHDVLDRIAANPLMHAKVYQDVRRAVLSKRPYIVLYVPEVTEVVVISVFHTSRDPKIWQSRI
jgi:plasmid stabilization system protein ParE